jgi:hypothetical protein
MRLLHLPFNYLHTNPASINTASRTETAMSRMRQGSFVVDDTLLLAAQKSERPERGHHKLRLVGAALRRGKSVYEYLAVEFESCLSSQVFRPQEPFPATRQHKVRGGAPFSLLLNLWCFVACGLSSRLFDLNSVVGVTDETTQQPKQDTYHEDDSFLYSSEIPSENIDKRDHATKYAHIEPPENPVVNSYIEVHRSSFCS